MKLAILNITLSVKKTRKREFLEQIERVVPWAALVALIAPLVPMPFERWRKKACIEN